MKVVYENDFLEDFHSAGSDCLASNDFGDDEIV